MRIFMSWSGKLSNEIATSFSHWIKKVIQNVDTYVSSEDIDKGVRWSGDIAKELANSNFGILFITKDNIYAPWINFEAGALSKAVGLSKVCPFLYDVKNSDIKDAPLLQFQTAVVNDKQDIYKLVKTINKSTEPSVEDNILQETFDIWWPKLEGNLVTIREKYYKESGESKPEVSNKDTISETLDEILKLTRDQQKVMQRTENLIPSDNLCNTIGRTRYKPEDFLPPEYVYRILDNYFKDSDMYKLLSYDDIRDLKIIYDMEDILDSIEYDIQDEKIKELVEELRRKHDILLDTIEDIIGDHQKRSKGFLFSGGLFG